MKETKDTTFPRLKKLKPNKCMSKKYIFHSYLAWVGLRNLGQSPRAPTWPWRKKTSWTRAFRPPSSSCCYCERCYCCSRCCFCSCSFPEFRPWSWASSRWNVGKTFPRLLCLLRQQLLFQECFPMPRPGQRSFLPPPLLDLRLKHHFHLGQVQKKKSLSDWSSLLMLVLLLLLLLLLLLFWSES